MCKPASRAGVVLHPRLIDRLKKGLQGKLAPISAPAGFGKTTRVTEWMKHHDQPAGWISLDEGSSDPTRFMAYFISALQSAATRSHNP